MNSDKMPIYYPLYKGCADVLYEVFHNGRRIDKTLDYHFRNNKKWGSKDRKWVAEQVYNCARAFRYYIQAQEIDWSDECLPHVGEFSSPLSRNRIEAALQIYLQRQGFSFDNFKSSPAKFKTIKLQAKDLCSDFFFQLGDGQLHDWSKILISQNQAANPYLRINLLKAPDRKTCLQKLIDEQIPVELVADCESALVLTQRKNIFQTKVFENGWIEMQDVASQRVAPLLDPRPGQRVVDACAGAGGKSLHIAELMKNKGQLLSLDIHAWKLEELKKRARRAGVHNIETRIVDSQKVIKRLHRSADRLLLDVPCSGSGVLRRNPDPKWRMNARDWQETVKLQQELLQTYSQMLKPGGRLVYSTCSVLPDENTNQISQFLDSEAGQGFQLVKEYFNWPHKNDYDGFYAAVLDYQTKSS